MRRFLLAMVGLAGCFFVVSMHAQDAPGAAGPLNQPAADAAPLQPPAPIERPEQRRFVPPKLIFHVDPEFSEEARRKKISGNVQVRVFIDATGKVTDVKVVRGVGYGLDEQAVKCVRQYVFRPAMKDGVAVESDIYVGVNFQIFGKPNY